MSTCFVNREVLPEVSREQTTREVNDRHNGLECLMQNSETFFSVDLHLLNLGVLFFLLE